MSSLAAALGFERMRRDDPAWALLRAENAPIAAAVLATHLGGERRRLPAPELFERVEADLDELRDHGFDLPRPAQAYCADWRAAGILVRRPSEESRGETFELSPGALAAIQFLSQLLEPRQTATESRLATIADRVGRLAQETDPDASSRLAQLYAERDRIDAQIERVSRGDVEVLDTAKAAERAREIIDLAETVPLDFARVRTEIERISRDLRERILDSDEAQSRVLDEIFHGVDLLAESDAGRSFAGFYALILDAETNAVFEAGIDSVLARDFAKQLTPAQRRALRRLLSTLQEQSAEVHEVMTGFARGLRRFVQSQEYQRDRAIKRLVRSALADALPVARAVKPYTPMGLELALSSVAFGSVGRIALHNPADLETTRDVESRADVPVDLDALRELARETEIDMAELTHNVNSVVAVQGRATIAEVLEHRPATQGVASLIGLIVLADRHGVREPGLERVRWAPAAGSPPPDAQQAGMPGRSISAVIERRAFTGSIA